MEEKPNTPALFSLLKFNRHGNLDVGGLKEIKGGSLEIRSAGSFVLLRPDKAHAVCLTWRG